jgi:hypothetical protein
VTGRPRSGPPAGPPDSGASPAASQPDPPPYLRVVRGDTTPEELSALVTALAAVARARAAEAGAAGPEPPRSHWADRSRMLRRALPHGHDAWRASARRGR